MKKILIAIALMMCAIFVGAEIKYQPTTVKVEQVEGKQHTCTDYVYVDKQGQAHRVYVGARGGMYYFAVAKSGKHAGEQVMRYLTKSQKAEIKQGK